MDESSVWAYMVFATTVDGTGKKKCDCKNNWTRNWKLNTVSVCLPAKADGTKLPSFTVFKGAERETPALDKKIKNCCTASSPKTWMNTELTHIWVNKVLGTFSFRLSLHAKKIDVSIVPGRCTKCRVAPDVSWNKPFKALATEKYDH